MTRIREEEDTKKITLRQPEATAAVRHQCMNPLKVAKFFQALHGVIKDCNPAEVWNMDETGLQLDVNPKKIVAGKGSRCLHMHGSGNREMITCIACVNAAGNFIPPHLIPKGKTLKALQSFRTEDAPTGTNWSVSDSGWTKQGIAKLWFTDTIKNIGPQRPQVLLVDGHDSHNFVELLELAIANSIHIVELPAHTSDWLQPLDRTIFKPMKDYYNSSAQAMVSNFPGVVTNKSNFTGLFATAWEKAVTKANIQAGFKASGIVPYNPAVIPQEAYLPNYLYSVAAMLENPALMDHSATPTADPAAASTADDHNYHCGNQLQPVEMGHEMMSAEIADDASFVEHAPDGTDLEVSENLTVCYDAADVPQPEATFTAEVIDIADYAASFGKPNFLSPVLPTDVLSMMESAMDSQQLHFLYCYERGFDLRDDSMFTAWKSLKMASASLATVSCSVVPTTSSSCFQAQFHRLQVMKPFVSDEYYEYEYTYFEQLINIENFI